MKDTKTSWRENRGKQKSDNAVKPKNEEDMDCTINTAHTTDILNLPDEVFRQIFSHLSEEEVFWGLGMTCRTFMDYALYNVNEIKLPRRNESQDKTLEKLKHMVQQNEFANWVRYVIMLGDHSKILLQLAHDELPGKQKLA